MNKKLYHSPEGFRKSMRMSRAQLFIFVEGLSDRYFYSRVADSAIKRINIGYNLILAEEVSGVSSTHKPGGGKEILIKFHKHLKDNNALIDKFQNKKTLAIFYLDKDLDDFLDEIIVCKHIVYTETYELENYLFIYGDIKNACASATDLDIQTVASIIGDQNAWRCDAAKCWINWIKLCFIAKKHKIGDGRYYSKSKCPLNNNCRGKEDDAKFRALYSRLKSKINVSNGNFAQLFKEYSSTIKDIYSKGEFDRIFKGSWYIYFLDEDIKRIANEKRYNRHGFEKRVLSVLSSTLNFNDEWTRHFKVPLINIIKNLY